MGRSKKPAGGILAGKVPCFGQLVMAAINYDFVRTDLTGKLSKHIYAPDLGLKIPS